MNHAWQDVVWESTSFAVGPKSRTPSCDPQAQDYCVFRAQCRGKARVSQQFSAHFRGPLERSRIFLC